MSERMNEMKKANGSCKINEINDDEVFGLMGTDEDRKVSKANGGMEDGESSNANGINGTKRTAKVNQTTTKEQWKFITGYPRYEISNNGNVRNVDTNVVYKPIKSTDGYYVIRTTCDAKRVEIRIHIEVARAFLNIKYDKYNILHKNGNKSDNRLENLEVKELEKHDFSGKVEGDFSEQIGKINFNNGEEYRYITNFENYIITSNGRIFQLDTQKLLKTRSAIGGYVRVSLIKKKEMKDFMVHCLVISHFHPNNQPGTWHVKHKNSDKKDNRLSNLEWKKFSKDIKTKPTLESLTKPDEIWKSIKDYPLFKVSNLGRVINLEKMEIKEIKPHKSGYVRAVIRNENGKKQQPVHVLVADAFMTRPNTKVTVNHKNGIKHDNRLENLEFATDSEQIKHAHRTGLIKRNDKNRRGSLVAKYKDGKKIKEYKSVTEAAKDTKISISRINTALAGGYNSTGYTWKSLIETYNDEIWKQVTLKPYKHYLISNYGRIRNGPKGRICTGANSDGYRGKTLYGKNSKKSLNLHILVALAFIPNPQPEKFDQVNHKDGNRSNNNVSNLEWTDQQGNTLHAWQTGLFKPKTCPVGQYTLEGKLIKTWTSITEASKSTRIADSTISTVCKGKGKTTGGFIWKYIKKDK